MLDQHPALQGKIKHIYDATQGKLALSDINTLPRQIFDIADDVKILDISHNRIKSLPDNFSQLSKLQVFFASYTDFTEVPAVLGSCQSLMTIGMQSCRVSSIPQEALSPKLQALILTANQLIALPESIGETRALRKLTLTGNSLVKLPESLRNCSNLEFIRLAANKLNDVPTWLLEHPSLSWYADSSNLYSPTATGNSALRTIAWQDLEITELLSSNRKNQVFAAKYRGTNKKVAVKLFGTALSADGYAEDELQAGIIAGGLGWARITDTPNGQLGLMMPLLDKTFGNLGQPPTLQTVTRDTYPPAQKFTAPRVINTLRSIATQLGAMHSKGIMHGDVYAHNILSSKQGDCYLTDFGAASVYIPSANSLRERVEVNAFGHLASQLSSRCQTPVPSLSSLQSACQLPVVSERPSFNDIIRTLTDLSA